jgi:D-sedoheptulose 7-phosphate isomerase
MTMNDAIDLICARLGGSVATFQAVMADEALLKTVAAAAAATGEALRGGGKLLTCGNGGSAADAQHLAAEFVCRLTVNRKAMASIALTTDSSALTAIGNDYGYEYVFSRQVEALGLKGDVLLAISTSGNSPNIVNALETARTMGLKTLGLSGGDGGRMAALCDYKIFVPSKVTAHVQEVHLALEHIYCHLVEREVLGGDFFDVQK